MTSSFAENWTHTAIVIALPPMGVTRHILSSIEDAAKEVLASPEFDEVSVHVVLSTPGNNLHTSPSLDAVLLKVLASSEASTISLVWCKDDGVEDEPFSRDLDALHAIHADCPLHSALKHESPRGIPAAIRDTVLEALLASDGAAGAPRALIEAAIAGFHRPVQHTQGNPADAVNGDHTQPTPPSVLGAPAEYLPVLSATTYAGPTLELPFHETPPDPRALDARTGQATLAGGRPDSDLDGDDARQSGPLTSEELDLFGLQPRIPADIDSWNTADSFRPLSNVGAHVAAEDVEASRLSSVWDSSLSDGYEAENNKVLLRPVSAPNEQPDSESSRWIPPVVHNVVSSVSSHIDQWRARRTKVRRAEEQIGVSALEHLPVYRGARRPMIYFALAASTEWDKQAIRTRDAALTLLSDALDQRWIAVALNLGSTLTRVAGPASPKRVAHDWRRIERNNDFDLGDAAAELSVQLSRDNASLRLRGHEVDTPHIVVFATEPPYVDSAAHSAYLTLLPSVQSVTWLLVGESGWMEFPPELDERPSRVLYAEQDGVAVLLSEVLAPPAVIPPEPADG
ncbi:hypothetical protein [Arthrobacter humicola]